jgi:hypothetical protein
LRDALRHCQFTLGRERKHATHSHSLTGGLIHTWIRIAENGRRAKCALFFVIVLGMTALARVLSAGRNGTIDHPLRLETYMTIQDRWYRRSG